MRRPRKAAALTFVITCMSGCATVPAVTTTYYFPRAQTQFVVTQTVGCNPEPADNGKGKKKAKAKDPDRILRSVITAQATTTNLPDIDWIDPQTGKTAVGSFNFGVMNGKLFDGDATVTLTPDGRLSAINATSTGEADTVIKDVATLAVAGAALGLVPPAGNQAADNNACKNVVDKYSKLGGKPDDPSIVTLTYTVTVRWVLEKLPRLLVDSGSPGYPATNYTIGQSTIKLVPDPASQRIYDDLKNALTEGRLANLLIVDPNSNLLNSPTLGPHQDMTNPLTLTRVAMFRVSIIGHAGDMTTAAPVWSGIVPVPTHITYQIPIPSPADLGKTAFGISLSDYGSITSLHYGSSSGAPDTLDAMAALAGAFKGGTTADKAAELKAQGDVIANQQRLIKCEVSPTTCT